MYSAGLLFIFLLGAVRGQQIGTLTAETHPALSIKHCVGKTCTTQARSVVLDSNWRWLHDGSGKNCYTGNTWDKTLCPDGAACAKNCHLDGADYKNTYGINAQGDALTLTFITKGQYSTNIGSRVYLMEDTNKYQMFNLLNQEFTFDVDMSKLPCGLNGALYFVEMDSDGGKSKFASNAAGAAYGTGYCDTQCPHDIKFINGEANIRDWSGSSSDPNSGTGYYGSCCVEMDIWEANSQASAYTPHSCSGLTGQYRCQGTECGDGDNRYGGICDKDGCDFNSWRMGNKSFLGPGLKVDTNKKMTVVTQFITNNNSTSGQLTEIRRVYVQNGAVIQNSVASFSGLSAFDSLTDSNCAAQKTLFGDTNSFASKGGMAAMGTAFKHGMTLVLSLWDDHAANMLWLDSNYPTDGDASKPGISRGPCSTSSGKPTDVESQSPGASVTFSNIRYGDIGSTFP